MRTTFGAGPGGRAATAGITFAALVVVTALGTKLFYLGDPLITLIPIAGLVAGTSCRRLLDSAVVAFASVVAGSGLAAFVAKNAWASPVEWLPRIALLALASAGVAALAALAADRSPRLVPVLHASAVALVLGALFLTATSEAHYTVPGARPLVEILKSTPHFTPLASDETIFLAWIRSLERGEAYYPAAARILQESNVGRGVAVDMRMPLAIRPPTLYMLLAALPGDGMAYVLAFVALVSAAAVAAYRVARSRLPHALAIVACVATAAYGLGYAQRMSLLETEAWAGLLGIVSVALLLGSARSRRRYLALSAAAAATALAASVVRELGVAFVLLGLIATLADGEARDKRLWLPWLAALAMFAGAFAFHWHSASQAIASAGPLPPVHSSWVRPFGIELVAGVALAADLLGWTIPPTTVLVLAGLAGALLRGGKRMERVALVGAVIGGVAALSFLGPPGLLDARGLPPAYWTALVAPAALGCAPLLLAPFVNRERTRETTLEEPAEETLPDALEA